ncbi:UNKNOWN [Stylonychia lemnae]|uniref:Uncharacterized protein n=1 Tax=Stylonychia lemnae TaxID=5949 RepID=A0A078AYL3_STYLE|nr:UNKNOWN [Stylonychia lemnae]|eukprot:CDW86302.1 UNKNOWN [Stylonychia lemnae]
MNQQYQLKFGDIPEYDENRSEDINDSDLMEDCRISDEEYEHFHHGKLSQADLNKNTNDNQQNNQIEQSFSGNQFDHHRESEYQSYTTKDVSLHAQFKAARQEAVREKSNNSQTRLRSMSSNQQRSERFTLPIQKQSLHTTQGNGRAQTRLLINNQATSVSSFGMSDPLSLRDLKKVYNKVVYGHTSPNGFTQSSKGSNFYNQQSQRNDSRSRLSNTYQGNQTTRAGNNTLSFMTGKDNSRKEISPFNQRLKDFEDKKRKKLLDIKEQQVISVEKECTFEPQTNKSQSKYQFPNRDLKQFIEDQEASEKRKFEKLERRKKEVLQRIDLQKSDRPSINSLSKKLVEKQMQNNQLSHMVYERLYQIKAKHQDIQEVINQDKSKRSNQDQSKTPTRASRSNSRDVRLYEEYKERKFRKLQLIQENKQTVNPSSFINKKSEQYFISKFTKEVIQLWKSLEVDEIHKANETLSFDIYLEFIANLGFLDLKFLVHQEKNIPHDNLIQELWRALGGPENNHVTLNNLRIFLLAIMGSFVDSDLDKKQQEFTKLPIYGKFNQHGDLFLDAQECPKIQKQFYQLCINRTHYQALFKEYRRLERSKKVQHVFQPKVSTNSLTIADNKRLKIEQEFNVKLSPLDWLIQPLKSPQTARKLNQINAMKQQEEIKDCTFKPHISKNSRNIASNCQDKVTSKTQRVGYLPGDYQSQGPKLQQIKEDNQKIFNTNSGKFEALYEMSKAKKYRWKRDKSPEEYEYERQKEECTFQPNRLKSKDQLIKAKSPRIDSFQPALNNSNIQATQQTIERLQKARQEKELKKLALEHGKFINRINSSSHMAFNPQSSRYTTNGMNQLQTGSKILNERSDSRNTSGFDGLFKSRCNSASAFKSRERSPTQESHTPTLKKPKTSKIAASSSTMNSDINQPSKSQYQAFNEFQKNRDNFMKSQLEQQERIQEKMSETPLLYVDINLGENQNERIIVFQGDSPTSLAQEFSLKNGIDGETQKKLEILLRSQIEKVKQKLENKVQA